MLLLFHLLARMLRKDKEEVEAIKHAKALEAEKAMYSVRLNPFETKFTYVSSFLMCVCLFASGPSLSQAEEGVQGEKAKR